MVQRLSRRYLLTAAAASIVTGKARWARAGTASPGISSTEVKLGTTAFYSGPASHAGAYGQVQLAYFEMINDRGGINGRKVNLISLDNAFSPTKAVEQTRRLVESDEVFAIAGSVGTPTNAAIQKYLNDKGVPNLFLTSGAERFNKPIEFPWIIPFYPSFVGQGVVRKIPSSRAPRCQDRGGV
jgi:branched-chain amino acid transport system substrate-binding protein